MTHDRVCSQISGDLIGYMVSRDNHAMSMGGDAVFMVACSVSNIESLMVKNLR